MDRDFGRAVLDRRLELGYETQQDAARAANVGTTTWGLLETGKALPKTSRVRRQIARALKWPPDALDRLGSSGPPSVEGSQPTEGPGLGSDAVLVATLQRLVQAQDRAIELLEELVSQSRHQATPAEQPGERAG